MGSGNSLPSQHTFDMTNMLSNSKKYNAHVKNSTTSVGDKYEDVK